VRAGRALTRASSALSSLPSRFSVQGVLERAHACFLLYAGILVCRRILDADDKLDWALFYYSGAAATAGLSYSGAVLATRSGEMPTSPIALSRLEAALDAAGIKMWELSLVDNRETGIASGAPLSMAGAA
jgi:hypothetical protein